MQYLFNNSDDFGIHLYSLGPEGSVENRGRSLASGNEWKIIFDPYLRVSIKGYK